MEISCAQDAAYAEIKVLNLYIQYVLCYFYYYPRLFIFTVSGLI